MPAACSKTPTGNGEPGSRGRSDSEPSRSARLLIHAAPPARADDWTLESLLQHLRRGDAGSRRDTPRPLALKIHDLQGRCVLALDEAGPLTDIALAPGTYHVWAQQGPSRRRYTITLEPGASFDLHLHPAPFGH
jgi:hypothetical protein